jgi:poly-gamma-glutamate capsule biosynthesis protein CapA/YwtB (metallophosphatase superfamily)
MSNISFVLAGDSFITQRLPKDEKTNALKDYILSFDVRFTNLEILLHDFEVYPAPASGGTWAAARPAVLQDLKYLGFNIMAWANNHTIDWNIGGILTTMHHLEENNCIHAGVGINLAEASQPRYIDTAEGRVALIGVTSTMSEWGMASAQRPDVLGRPGANVLRYQEIHHISPADYEKLQEIVEQTDINAHRQLGEKEGFTKPAQGGYYVGNLHFEPGAPGTTTTMNKEDSDRIVHSIREAACQADIVLVSHHTHECKGMDKELPADFARDFAKLCIDSGASAYIGHGPHIWRGIEIYKNKPIFYSLGDFIFQNDSVERQPTEFYNIYNLSSKNTVSEGLNIRSNNGKRGLPADIRVFQSALPSFSIENGKLHEIFLKPVALGFTKSHSLKGRPYFADAKEGKEILQHIAAISAPFGTKIAIQDGLGVISIK